MGAPAEQVSDRATLRAALAGVRGLVLDADGVIVLKGEIIPGAAAALDRLDARGVPFRIVTNFSSTNRTALADRFARGGLPIPAGRIITAASATATHTAVRYAGRPLYVIATAEARREFDGQWLLSPEESAQSGAMVAAVVIGDGGDDLSYANMDAAFRFVHAGADLVAMHRNPWWITARGPTLDAGAFVAGLEYATGRRARVVGKPAAHMFRQALAGLARDLGLRRLPAADAAMVGDDVRADVGAAQRVGLRGILVLTGKHGLKEATAARLARGSRGPDATAESLAEVVAALD